MSSHCFGRFQTTLPDDLTVTGRRQRIYGVDVSTTSVPPGGGHAAWEDRVAAIRKAPSPPEPPPVIQRTFNLKPGIPAIWYQKNPSLSTNIILEAARPADDHILSIVCLAGAGKEAIAETLVKDIIDSYAPGVSNYGFCVGFGSLTIEAAQVESSAITFKHRKHAGFEIQIDTETVDQPHGGAYSDLEEEKGFAQASGANLTVLMERERVVAGLPGTEIRILVAPPKEPVLMRLTWHFDGASRNASKPKINMMAIAKHAQHAELEAAWETLLGSLHALPVRRP